MPDTCVVKLIDPVIPLNGGILDEGSTPVTSAVNEMDPETKALDPFVLTGAFIDNVETIGATEKVLTPPKV
jgi:hypothetical protein